MLYHDSEGISRPRQVPALPPPVDPTDPGRGPAIMGVSWALSVIAIIVIIARFHVRARIQHALSWDDWFMLSAVVMQIAFQSLITEAYSWGLGKHDMNLTLDPQLVNILKWNWISTPPSVLVSILARISAAIFLVRLFGVHTQLKLFLIIFTTLQTVVALGSIIIAFVQVDPVEGLWTNWLPARRWDPRIAQYYVYVSQSLFSFSDLTYVLLPVIIVWRLNMRLNQKVGLICLLGLSVITMTASIAKTVLTSGANGSSDTQQDASPPQDAQYNASLSILMAAAEQCLVIIMGCIPTLRPLMKLDIPLLRSLSSGIASLLGKTKGKKTARTRDTSSYRNNPDEHRSYHNLDDLDSSKLGRLHLTPSEQQLAASAATVSHTNDTNGRSLESGRITRTDDFAITCNDRTAPREAV